MQSLALYSSQMRRENTSAGSATVFFRPTVVENAHYSQPESFFDLDRRSNTREEHAELYVPSFKDLTLRKNTQCYCLARKTKSTYEYIVLMSFFLIWPYFSCEAVLLEPHRFPSVPRYNYVPDFPLEGTKLFCRIIFHGLVDISLFSAR
jgi:hypothetical protein